MPFLVYREAVPPSFFEHQKSVVDKGAQLVEILVVRSLVFPVLLRRDDGCLPACNPPGYLL